MAMKTSPEEIDDTNIIKKESRKIVMYMIIKQLACFIIMSILALIFLTDFGFWYIVTAQLLINIGLFFISYCEATNKLSSLAAIIAIIGVLIFGEFGLSIGAKTQTDSKAESTREKADFNIKVDKAIDDRMRLFNTINAMLDSALMYQHCLRASAINETEKLANFRTIYNTKIESIVTTETANLKATKQTLSLVTPYTPKSLQSFPVFNELTVKPYKICIDTVVNTNRDAINTKIRIYNSLVSNGDFTTLQTELNSLELKQNKTTFGSNLTKFAWDAFKEVQLIIFIQLIVAIAAESFNKSKTTQVLRRNTLASKQPFLPAQLEKMKEKLRQVTSYAKQKLFLVLDTTVDKELIDRIHYANGFHSKSITVIPSNFSLPKVSAFVDALEHEKVIDANERTCFANGQIVIYAVDSKFARDFLNYTPRSY
jgi:hypothetical protein